MPFIDTSHDRRGSVLSELRSRHPVRERFYRLFGNQLPIKQQLSNLLFFFGILAGIIGAGFCLGTDGPPVTSVLGFTMAAVSGLLWLLARKHPGKTMGYVTIGVVIVNFLLFPALFLTGGDVYSGVTAFLALGLGLGLFELQGKKGVWLAAAEIAWYFVLFNLAYFKINIPLLPRLVILKSGQQQFSFFAITANILLVSFALYVLCRTAFRAFLKEDRMTDAAISEAVLRSELDPLSGLYNRATLYRKLESSLRRSRPQNEPVSLILFDMDLFKEVNDVYGHTAGDACIAELSRLFRNHLKDRDFIGRYGGEEFVMVLPGCTLKEASVRAEEVRRAVESARFSEEALHLTVSAGVVCTTELPSENDTSDLLIDAADNRMYRSKSGGRNLVVAGTGIDVCALYKEAHSPTPIADVMAASDANYASEAHVSAEDLSYPNPVKKRPGLRERFVKWVNRPHRSGVEDVGLKQEAFWLLLQQTGEAILLMIVVHLVLTRSAMAIGTYLFCGLFTGLLYLVLRNTQKRNTVKWLYAIYCAGYGIILMPTLYLFGGGLLSGVPVLALLVAASCSVLLDGYLLVLVLLISATNFLLVLGLDLFHPGLLDSFTHIGTYSYFLTFVAVCFVGVTVGRVMRMLYRNFLENRNFSEELIRQLWETSTVDPLTGAYDRRYLFDYLEESRELCAAGDIPTFSLILFDLDHFKDINDQFGHLAGDSSLRALAGLVRRNLRETDILARYGGEEFLCVLRGAGEFTAYQRAEQIRRLVQTTNLLEGTGGSIPHLTISCGVVMYRPGMSVSDLIRAADDHLYLAKRRGRNRVE